MKPISMIYTGAAEEGGVVSRTSLVTEGASCDIEQWQRNQKNKPSDMVLSDCSQRADGNVCDLNVRMLPRPGGIYPSLIALRHHQVRRALASSAQINANIALTTG